MMYKWIILSNLAASRIFKRCPMYIIKCPCCQSSQVKKNGLCKGVQLYKCRSCGKQFLGTYHRLSFNSIWQEYLESKQTISEIANRHYVSESTVKQGQGSGCHRLCGQGERVCSCCGSGSIARSRLQRCKLWP